MPTYEEVLEAREKQAASASGPTPQQISAFLRESARGAAVLTDLLDSPAWDVFRSTIAADLHACTAERATLRDQIEAGTLVGDERARADLRLQYLRGAIEKLALAMDLPKHLIAQDAALQTMAGGPPGASAR